MVHREPDCQPRMATWMGYSLLLSGAGRLEGSPVGPKVVRVDVSRRLSELVQKPAG